MEKKEHKGVLETMPEESIKGSYYIGSPVLWVLVALAGIVDILILCFVVAIAVQVCK